MKKLLKLTCILCSVLGLNAQSYLVDFSQMTWVDINPDSVIIAPESAGGSGYFTDSYVIDLNNDLNNDIGVNTSKIGGMGGGGSSYRITPLYNTQIARGQQIPISIFPSCQGNNFTQEYLSAVFNTGDTLLQSSLVSTLVYFWSNSYSGNCYSSFGTVFSNAPDTVYPCLKIENSNYYNYYFLRFILTGINNKSNLDGYYISNNIPLGIESKEKDLSAYVYDNVLYIKSLNSNKKIKVDIFNLLGKKVLEVPESNYFSAQQVNIPLTLEKGCYILSLITDEGKQNCIKVIID
jgi:hypothetical protein